MTAPDARDPGIDTDPTALHLDELRYVEGSRGTALRGAILGIVAVGSILGYLVYAYFYLSVSVGEWPPPGAPALPVGLPALLVAALVATLVPAVLAWRAADRRQAVTIAVSLGGLALVGAAVLALGAADLARLDLDPRARAYDGIVVTLQVFHGVVTGAGIVGALLVAYEAVRLGAQRWVTSATVVVVAWWTYVVLGWVGVAAVVYGWPELT